MRVWTDGSTHLVVGPRGLTRHVKGKAEAIPLGEGPASSKGTLAWHSRGVLAVDAKAQIAWVDWAGKLREVRLGGGTPPKALEWKAKDLLVRESTVETCTERPRMSRSTSCSAGMSKTSCRHSR